MALESSKILKFIRAESDHPMKIKELARAMSIRQDQYASFRRKVKKLIDEGHLVRLKRGRVGPADQMDVLVGRISITRGGVGFVEQEGGGEDILIPSMGLLTALDGDKVMARLTGTHYGRQAGVVIKVTERADRKIVGTLYKQHGLVFVKPDNPRIHRDIYISAGETKRARHGEKVVVELILWDDQFLNPQGRVTERIGFPDTPGVDMLTIIKRFNLPEEFSPKILTAAEKAAAADTRAEQKRRIDLTSQITYTIDPSDAKDHDDAVSVVRTAQGYRLGVHIADVAFFVKEGTALDTEGFNRGNSVYLPGMVVPMLPPVLSNDICSLRPDRRRLAHSVIMDFDRSGKLLEWSVEDTVIRSRAKLAYEEVQEFFDTGTVTSKLKRVAQNLTAARELARKLSERRFAEGSLDFDLPEAKIILNEQGEVLEIGNRVRLESHRLVEEFMLAANKAVALEVFRKGEPLLYRVHAKPDLEKLHAFSDMMTRLGHTFPVSKNVRPVQFARFLDTVKDSPEADFVNELLLRSMQKAVYQRENIGHFGLAFTHYTHFTSPIRRYPDLLVHRLVRKVRKGKYPVAFARRVGSVIDHVGKHCSETERTAETAEREAVRTKQVAYMASHLGDEYAGVISGTAPYGFFVRLDNVGVEGLVRMSTIDDDYYRYEEKQYRLVGRRTGRTYRIGDAVRVGVAAVDRERNDIDLFLARPKKASQASRKKAKGRMPRRKKRVLKI
ncbi:MAG: ribonuclease R [Candidatus Zixiibacteriota bacterium]|nr:MAG: ribonuclease R [candidate division Zixibacteria bacterium]